MKLKKSASVFLLSLSASTLLLTACSGDDGSNGINGANGIDGMNGIDGSNGANGSNGTNGINGSNGAGQIIALERIGRTDSRGFAVAAAEIVDFDKTNQRILTVNAQSGQVDVFTAANLDNPTLFSSLNIAQMLLDQNKVASTAVVGAANSVNIHGNYAAIAVQAEPKTDNGWVVFLNLSDLSYANAVQVGALPDMLTFTPDGSKVLVANEGEPADYSIDPEGTVSVITVADFSVSTISFSDFNSGASRYGELPLGKMILDGYSATNAGNKATVAQSFEPEYIAVSADNQTAYVTLQENNAIALVNLSDNSIRRIVGLGFKDHSIPGNEIDAGDSDGGINIKTWPVMGIYMPDSITTMTYNGKTYLLTANEGDSREDWLSQITDQTSCTTSGYYFYGGTCLDEVRVKHLNSRAGLTFSTAVDALKSDDYLGRLKASYFATKAMNGSTIKKVYAYGARSFSIWDIDNGLQVFDSGSQFERITAGLYGINFNNNHEANEADGRSDDKGPEPEALAIGKINGHTYAFIGLERMGGIMVYDVSNPFAPSYVQYINDRNFDVSPGEGDAGDLGPESFRFVSAENSPNGKPLLITGNEISGTTAIYEISITLP